METKEPTTMLEGFLSSPLGTRIAGVLFLLGKASGMLAVLLGFAGFKRLGGSLLVTAFVSIFTAVFLCVRDMRNMKKTDEKRELSEEELIERLIKEGRLNTKINEVRSKIAA